MNNTCLENLNNEIYEIENGNHSYICHNDDYNHEHEHTCITNLNSKTLGNVVIESNKKKQITAYLFEFACVFHSFIIGLSLGMTNNQASIKTLTIALCFHQFLEGISLGIVVGESNLKTFKSLLITFAYSLTTPLAIIIGYVLDTYYMISADDNKVKIIATSAFQGFAGGMLLYIALFQLIAEEFSKESLQKNKNILFKLCLYISLLSGASSMCIMSLWI